MRTNEDKRKAGAWLGRPFCRTVSFLYFSALSSKRRATCSEVPNSSSSALFYLCPVSFHSVSNPQREPALPFRSRPLLPLLSMEDIFSSSVIRTPLAHLARCTSSGHRKFDKSAVLASAGNLVGGLVMYPRVSQVAI